MIKLNNCDVLTDCNDQLHKIRNKKQEPVNRFIYVWGRGDCKMTHGYVAITL